MAAGCGRRPQRLRQGLQALRAPAGLRGRVYARVRNRRAPIPQMRRRRGPRVGQQGREAGWRRAAPEMLLRRRVRSHRRDGPAVPRWRSAHTLLQALSVCRAGPAAATRRGLRGRLQVHPRMLEHLGGRSPLRGVELQHRQQKGSQGRGRLRRHPVLVRQYRMHVPELELANVAQLAFTIEELQRVFAVEGDALRQAAEELLKLREMICTQKQKIRVRFMFAE